MNEVKVDLRFGNEIIPVGRLATKNYNIYFEYHDTFIDLKLNISPLKLCFPLGSSGQWELALAYDLTFSSGPHGQQNGHGRKAKSIN